MSIAIVEEIARKLGGQSVLGRVTSRIPVLLPELVMVIYHLPDTVPVEDVRLNDLPPDWRRHEAWSQGRGDAWHEGRAALLRVPSAIVPVAGSPDLNVLVNHSHPAATSVRIVGQEAYSFDPRLF